MEMLQTHCYATGTVASLWKRYKLVVMQQALLRYYGNALKDLTCHSIFNVKIVERIGKTLGECKTELRTEFW
jgi:hypothetical protein